MSGSCDSEQLCINIWVSAKVSFTARKSFSFQFHNRKRQTSSDVKWFLVNKLQGWMASDVLQLMWKLWRLIVHDCYNFCVRGSGFCIKNYWRNKARRRLLSIHEMCFHDLFGAVCWHTRSVLTLCSAVVLRGGIFLVNIFTSSFGTTRHFVERLRSLPTFFEWKYLFLLSRRAYLARWWWHHLVITGFRVRHSLSRDCLWFHSPGSWRC